MLADVNYLLLIPDNQIIARTSIQEARVIERLD
jgi:hypothetical protein